MEKKSEWNEYEKLVLYKLEELGHNDHRTQEQIRELQITVAKLQVRAGMWGALAGVVPGIIAYILK